ncbi:hypothetical protein HF324_27740 [Chitinophaga oryzae]|uniref:Uncharacterized protein n=1 Tax=Chitinophaga oryzae TaxID=2725414 RepID=A0AAE6ZMZ1_9BACT|nr:hypothetical protein [Chitinophaga oryzae]QJB34918.1 hypothetical protein HF329_27880 [Chitinophaga oryzae]QJB41429.1 hypothetical protein HF324_27740 [Chitinophaga oryzae]
MMMWTFFKNRSRSGIGDRTAATIAAAIIRGQLRLSDWLAAKDRKLRTSQRKILFLLFFALFFYWAAWTIVSVFSPDAKTIKAELILFHRDSTGHASRTYPHNASHLPIQR